MWDRFVEVCCALIIEAVEAARREPGCALDRKEGWFAAATVIHLRNRCDADNLPFTVDHELFVLAQTILAEGEDPDKAPRIDVCVRHMGMRWTTYLPIEAKVLTTKSIGSRRPGRSVKAYVADGLCRFVDSRYGAEVDHGVMLGFILSGKATKLAKRIATEITTQEVAVARNLVAVASSRGHYESEHQRNGRPSILLQHLLLPAHPC